jgi:hypothetical protein
VAVRVDRLAEGLSERILPWITIARWCIPVPRSTIPQPDPADVVAGVRSSRAISHQQPRSLGVDVEKDFAGG